jgi:hypothetical protein
LTYIVRFTIRIGLDDQRRCKISETPTTYWWIDHASTVLSIPLALLGFGITLWQLVRTKRSAEAALDATRGMQQQVRRLSVVSLLPELHHTDTELHRAIEKKSVELTQLWLATWEKQASQTRGHLMDSPREANRTLEIQESLNSLLAALQSSIVAAAAARNDMMNVQPDQLKDATAAVRERIVAVTSQLGELKARHDAEPGVAR